MSTFGVIAILVFLLLMGGLVALENGHNSDLPMAKIMMFLLRLLVVAEFILAIFEFPAYVADGIFFACMGVEWLAYVMFAICGGIVMFILILALARLNWDRHLTATPFKLIVLGIVMLALFTYTELFNGFYSFDNMKEFRDTKARYEEYDDNFFPTKYIYHYSKTENLDMVALYPFDVTTSQGKLPMIYKGETYLHENPDGTTELYFFPFTYKLYEGSTPIPIRDAAYTVEVEQSSASATSDSSASATDAAAQTTTTTTAAG
ncbi:MAG: hypothetical protein IJC18_02165 [Clostridia bacterium]|nr:hypothetical protein [Clostridia bacterium]